VQFKKRKTGHALMGTTAPVANSTTVKVESVASVAPPPPPLSSATGTSTSNEALMNTVTSSVPVKEEKEAAITAVALAPAVSNNGGGGFKMKIGNMSSGGSKRQFRVRPPSP
jgi:hypothetical protein